jgi:predicted ribosomally synthesized peptide with SipW-like signal peptide
MSTAIDVPRTRKRKIKAILAGGLVLGVGAAITLATWNDSEFATGTFTAGSFNVQGSADGTTFADHVSSGTAAALTFSTGFNNMSPGDVVAAPFVLRLDGTTTNNASVIATSAAASGTGAANFTYGIVQVASTAACTSIATGTATLVPAGTAMTAVTGATAFALAKGTAGAPGASVFLCLQVKASAGLVQASSAVGTWGFTATSQ